MRKLVFERKVQKWEKRKEKKRKERNCIRGGGTTTFEQTQQSTVIKGSQGPVASWIAPFNMHVIVRQQEI